MKRHLLLLWLVCSFGWMQAQIVSMDERRTGPRGVQGNFDLTFNYTHNNDEVLQGGAKLKLQYNDGPNSYQLSTDYSQSMAAGQRYVNNGSMGVLYNYRVPNKFIVGEAIGQYQYNGVKKLKSRVILGGGPRFKIADKEKFKLSLVAYSIYLYELYEHDEKTKNKKSLMKFSSMLTAKWKISSNANFSHSTYYEPDYSDPDDFRIWSQTTLGMKFTDKLSFNLFFKIDYDSVTPQGVDKMYYTINNGFSYKF